MCYEAVTPLASKLSLSLSVSRFNGGFKPIKACRAHKSHANYAFIRANFGDFTADVTVTKCVNAVGRRRMRARMRMRMDTVMAIAIALGQALVCGTRQFSLAPHTIYLNVKVFHKTMSGEVCLNGVYK